MVALGNGSNNVFRSRSQYCTAFRFPEQELFNDLARHFQISRNADKIGNILVSLLNTDFAFGLATDSLNDLRGNQDALLAKMAQAEVG